MKKASIATLKVNLSRYLDQVKRGESILVIERKQPVAMIVPVSSAGKRLESDNDRLARLERNGLIRRGTPGSVNWLLKRQPLKVTGSVLQDCLINARMVGEIGRTGVFIPEGKNRWQPPKQTFGHSIRTLTPSSV